MMETVDSEFVTNHANTMFFSLGNQPNPHLPTPSLFFPLLPTLKKKYHTHSFPPFPTYTHPTPLISH